MEILEFRNGVFGLVWIWGGLELIGYFGREVGIYYLG